MRSLYEACERIRLTKAKRIPLIDHDDETFHEVVVSVLTQYRILKFIALNVSLIFFFYYTKVRNSVIKKQKCFKSRYVIYLLGHMMILQLQVWILLLLM